MKIFNIFLVITVLATGCYSGSEMEQHPKTKIRDSVLNSVADKAGKKYPVYASGSGFFGPDGYQELTLFFDHKGILNKDEARFMIVDIAAIFLKVVNSNEEIRSDLYEYPFTPKNLLLAIFPRGPGFTPVYHPNLSIISIEDGNIVFKTNVRKYGIGEYTELRETIEEALGKLREQGRDVPEYFKNWKPEDKE